jgi:nitrogen fixation NifU-like protein
MDNQFDELERQITARMKEMYGERVVDHAMNPRNLGDLSDADGFAVVRSQCGEVMKMWIKVDRAQVAEVTFWTDGCGATVACGSIATELIRGKDIAEVLAICEEDISQALGGLPEGNYHCASLAVSAIKAAVKDYISMRREPWRKAYRRPWGYSNV